MTAAKHTDPIVGMDMHMIQPPPPAPPMMVPHPVAGMVIDPADYQPGACTVYVNGLPRARAGNACLLSPPHVPLGGAFVKPPLSEAELYQGSSTVTAEGEALSAAGHQVLGCHDVGMPAPARAWKNGGAASLMMPGSVVLPIPGGAPVNVGGAPVTAAHGSAERVGRPRTLEVRLRDAASGGGIAGLAVDIELAGGEVRAATTDGDGVIRLTDLPARPNSAMIRYQLPDDATVDTTWRWLGRVPTHDAASVVVLHGLAPASGARRHVATVRCHHVAAGDTLDAIAQQYGVDVGRLARFNFGTDDPAQVQAHLRAHVGCVRADAGGAGVVTGGERAGIVFVPEPLARLVLLDTAYDFALAATTRVVERLETTLPVDQLRAILEQLGDRAFILWAARVFGPDVGLAAYRAFVDDLRNNAVAMPPIQLVAFELEQHVGAYDSRVGAIQVARQLARSAEADSHAAWTLAAVVLEEFGHHVDYLLRFQYSDVGGDAPDDEGARFAFNAVQMAWRDTTSAPFATYERDGARAALTLDWSAFQAHADELVGEAEQRDDGRSGAREYFGSGLGDTANPGRSFAHRSIEAALATAGFSDAERDAIYYGNWMRDFSQLLTESTIRPANKRAFEIGPGNIFSRDALTQVVNVLGYEEFAPYPPTGGEQLTKETLGVYRCEEHIDNPDGLLDSRAIDPGLRGAVPAAEIAVDTTVMMKAYIRTTDPRVTAAEQADQRPPTPRWTSALEYVKAQLGEALSLGRTPTGLRHLGQGLHTLEDFYAHSNFCELALIKAGHTSVFPWTGGAVGGIYPLVTGKFGKIDTSASIFLGLAEILSHAADQCMTFDQLRRQRAVRPSDPMIRALHLAAILIGDIMPGQRPLLHQFVHGGEQVALEAPALAWIACNLIGWMSTFFRNSIGFLVHLMASQIDEAETMFLDTSDSTNPTHSQLAKDHDDHPLHVPAARAAQIAARHVGFAMTEAWAGRRELRDLKWVADQFFVHPHFITGTSYAGVREIQTTIETWAQANSGALAELPTRGDRDGLRQWGHNVSEQAAALQADPGAYLNARIQDFHTMRRDLAADAQAQAQSMLEGLEQLYRDLTR